MIQSEREKLFREDRGFVSIGVTQGGVPRRRIGIPWEVTAHAYNMRIPNVYIAPEDLQDGEIMEQLRNSNVIGCYIWTPLEDYRFLAEFKQIEDIRICCADALRDLDFLDGLYACDMLFLQNAKLKNLNAIIKAKQAGEKLFGCLRCVGLENCRVEDLSAFETEEVQFSEFLVWQPEGSNEGDRWCVISARTRRYYEYKE